MKLYIPELRNPTFMGKKTLYPCSSNNHSLVQYQTPHVEKASKKCCGDAEPRHVPQGSIPKD